MSLMVLIPSSSFFLPTYLTQLIKNEKHNSEQLGYAVKQGNIAALHFSAALKDVGSKSWLTLKAELAKTQGQAAYDLANWFVKKSEAPNTTEELLLWRNKAIMWFEQAIRLGSKSVKVKAKLALSQLYFNQNELLTAQLLLHDLTLAQTEQVKSDELAALSVRALILQINIAIALGQTKIVNKKLLDNQFLLSQSVDGRKLIEEIEQFRILNTPRTTSVITSNKETRFKLKKNQNLACPSSLQLFATNLKHLRHLEQLQLNFIRKPIADYICLAKPRYISKTMIACYDGDDTAIQCEESDWQEVAGSVDSRHIGLMVEKGGANVHLGMMYFDSQDTLDVFTHEISHLLGFVDEYPIVKTHGSCQQVQSQPFSHNIAVLKKRYYGEQDQIRKELLISIPWANLIRKTTSVLQQVEGQQKVWQLGTPESQKEQVGIFPAESCDNSIIAKRNNFSAFKPVTKRTQLRYYSSEFPKEYLTMLNEQFQRFIMPSFHYNIALALYQQGAISEAKHWLEQAALWEKNAQRKKVILQGAYSY